MEYTIACPCGAPDALATFGSFTFESTSVDLVPCTTCRTSGVSSYVVRKTYLLANAAPVVVGHRHVDGLVTMVGA